MNLVLNSDGSVSPCTTLPLIESIRYLYKGEGVLTQKNDKNEELPKVGDGAICEWIGYTVIATIIDGTTLLVDLD